MKKRSLIWTVGSAWVLRRAVLGGAFALTVFSFAGPSLGDSEGPPAEPPEAMGMCDFSEPWCEDRSGNAPGICVDPEPQPAEEFALDFVTQLPAWLQPSLPEVKAPADLKVPRPQGRPCPPVTQFEHTSQLRSSRGLSREQEGSCVVGLSGFKDQDGNSRSLYWKTDGNFSTVIFLNRPGAASKNSWGRTLQLFPRLEPAPDLVFEHDGTGTVLLAQGTQMKIAADDSPTAFSGGELQVSEETLAPPQRGGVELRIHAGILIDYGWKRGGMPVDQANGKARIQDGAAQECTVLNSELLRYVKLPNGKLSHAEFKFKTDPEFASFLTQRCPALDVRMLRETRI